MLKDAINNIEDNEKLQLDMMSFIKSYQEPYIKKETLTLSFAIEIIIDALIKPSSRENRIGWEICQRLMEGGKQIFSREYKLYLPSKTELKKQLDAVHPE